MKERSAFHQILKAKGYRRSRLRELLIALLRAAECPLSVPELQEILAEQHQLQPNKSSVYRELDILVEEQIVQEFSFLDGKKRYELLDSPAKPQSIKSLRHSHFICSSCGSIRCVELSGDFPTTTNLSQQKDLQIDDFHLELHGLCGECKN